MDLDIQAIVQEIVRIHGNARDDQTKIDLVKLAGKLDPMGEYHQSMFTTINRIRAGKQ